MKHLGGSARVRETLPQGRLRWRVVSFFFDFRLGQEVGNTFEGLLRSTLDQIFRYDPNLSTAVNFDKYDVRDMSLDFLKSMLEAVVLKSAIHFLICIDGLDELSGNARSLLNWLLPAVQKLHGIKICLASRAEPLIQYILSSVPNLHMSDYNTEGIQKYIDLSIEQFRPLLDAIQLTEIRDLIHERAEGVFLWVYLVLEEVLLLSVSGASAREIKAELERLPKEVEALYQRILERIPSQRRSEAAIVYTLIASCEEILTLGLLRAAMLFIAQKSDIDDQTLEIPDSAQFQRRLCATMGGLIEIQLTTDQEVRLIHETVRAFSNKSQWTKSFIPSSFVVQFPNCIWTRLRCKAILASESLVVDLDPTSVVFPADNGKTKITVVQFESVMRQLSCAAELIERLPLLYHSIRYLPIFLEMAPEDDVDADFRDLRIAAMQSRLAELHAPMFERELMEGLFRLARLSQHRIFDLILAAVHASHQYLVTQRIRIQHLSDFARNLLVLAAFAASSELDGNNCSTNYLQPGYYNTSSLADLREMTSMIYEFSEEVTSLHLAIFLRLHYKDMPGFLMKHCDPMCTPRPWPVVKLPSWARVRHSIPHEPPLFGWACDHPSDQNESGVTPESQLSILLLMGVDINQRSLEGYSIVHYLITIHIFSHALTTYHKGACLGDDMAVPVEKLYALEKAQADFTMEFEYRTPLQAFRMGRDRLYQLPPEDLMIDIPHIRLDQIEFMLYHKLKTGHLPQPMMGVDYNAKDAELLRSKRCTVCESRRSRHQSSRHGSRRREHDGRASSGTPSDVRLPREPPPGFI